MSWEPWKDIEEFGSDIFKSVEKAGSDVGKSIEKATSDVWHSDTAQVAVPAAIGFAVGGPGGAIAGASYGLASLQQEKAIEEAEKMQEKQIAAQKEMQEKQIELEKLKMEEQKQLMDLFTTQDKPVYLTPSDIVKPATMTVSYLLYVAIGIGILIYMRKIKL
ncbi:hypothetical protein ES702_07046 [subsurface metagenome]